MLVGGSIVFIALVFFFVSGLFPVAIIGSEYVWYRDFSRTAGALEQFDRISRQIEGMRQTEDDVHALRKAVLGEMIAARILEAYLEREGRLGHIRDGANKQIDEAMKSTNAETLPQATEKLYNLSADDFRDHILYPRAFQEALRADVEASGKNFTEVLSQELRVADVRIFLVPWKWENGELVDK